MFWQIVKFEILYRLKRPATYIYFFLFLVIAFVFVSAPGMSFAESGDKLNANAPLLMSQLITALMMFGSIVCAAIMGVPVFRDYDYNFYEIIHSLPVRKMDYLWGRFFGSFLISLLIFSSIIFGMMLGYSMPWLEDDTLGPFVLASFINPFLFFVLPNTFILGTLFFISGSFFRSQAAIYAQGVVFLVLYIGSSMLLANVEQNAALSLFDPFGMEAVSEMTKYWTTAEKNILQVYPEGWILYNRIIWIALAAGASILFTWRFNPAKNYSFASGRSRRKNITISNSQPVADIKVSRQTSGWKTGFLQWWHLTVFYFKGIVTSIPFLIMICCAIGLIAIARIGEGMMYGTKSFPVTYMLLDSITGNFMLFMIIIVIVYSGEVLWKDINTRFSLILDSSPISSVRILLSKFNAMVMAELVLLVTIILTGMVIQVTAGFYDFQLGVYIKFLVLNTFPFIFFITFITFLVHTLVNNKFLGHGIVILFYLSRAFYDNIGLNHILFKYGNSPTESYSGMNGLQKFSGPAFTIDFHWLLLSVVLLIITIFFIKRGSELGIRTRSRLFLLNWKQSRLRYAVIGGLVLFILSGFNIYYNINVLNTYMTKKEYRHFRAEYEKKYSLYKNYPQPRITDVNLKVDIFPDEYDKLLF